MDFSAVFRRCLRDEDEEVRRRAIEGLWENEERRLIAPLGDLLAHDPSPAVRAAAAMGLGKFAELAQLDKLLRKDGLRVEASLLAVLQNITEDMTVRRRALESVAVFNSPKVDEFIRWAYDSDDLTLKGSALYAMGRTGEAHWLECLVRETRSPSPTLRFEAANACGQMEEEAVIPHLIPLMQDDDLQVQLASIRAVGAIGGSLAKKALRRCIRDGDAAVEDAARESLETVDAMVDVYSFNYPPLAHALADAGTHPAFFRRGAPCGSLPPPVSSQMRGPIRPSSVGAHLVGVFPLPCPHGCGDPSRLSSVGAHLVGAFPLPCPRGCGDPSRLLPQGSTLWAPSPSRVPRGCGDPSRLLPQGRTLWVLSPSRVLADAGTHPAFFRRGVPCGCLPPPVSSRMRGPIPPSSAGAHLVGAFPFPCPRRCGDPSRLLPQGSTLWVPSPSRVLADAGTHPAFFRRGVPCGRLPPPVSSRTRRPIPPSSAGAYLVGAFPLPCPRGWRPLRNYRIAFKWRCRTTLDIAKSWDSGFRLLPE